jgi:two-component system NtrC family sensor kinase
MPTSPPAARLGEATLRAEIVAAGWEIFSALLFISAVVPAAFATPWPEVIFLGTLALSAALARPLLAQGVRGYAVAGVVRAASWPIAVAPLVGTAGPKVVVAALAFGMMAGAMRRAIYRRLLAQGSAEEDDRALARGLMSRLAESAATAGIVGGHVLMLFSVAFLRTKSQLIFQAWFEIVPALALLGTAGFTLAVRPAASVVLRALEAGPSGPRALLLRGLSRARALPNALAILNFVVWMLCTAIGVQRMRPGPRLWRAADVVMELALGALFAWGVAFYQRAWQTDQVAPVVDRLSRWTGVAIAAEPISLERRMLRDFGLPLLFTAALSLLSTIGLYRALGAGLGLREDLSAVTALFASFAILVIAVGGVVARAARDVARPMTELAGAADRVARGRLDAPVPKVSGPVEVVALGESVEGMREALGRTIGELEKERAGLEANVEARTAELRRALDELRRTQAALVQGERLATIGELSAGIAHEIYNPLNAIAGAAEPLGELAGGLRRMIDAYREAEAELGPARRRALAELRRELDVDASLDDLAGIATVIRRATSRSVKIVQNLRNFARGSGEAVPSDLHAGLEETLMLLMPRLRQGSIEVTRRFGALPLVTCRPEEMNQVFMNLLVNAAQAIEQGPSRERTIQVETGVEGDAAVVIVSDSGPGVPEGLERRIFDPFFTTKPRGQGTGLGLSISTEIVRRHGGTLTLEPAGAGDVGGEPPSSTTAGGARFVCRIPLGRASPSSRPAPDAPSPPGSEPGRPGHEASPER